MIQDYEYLAKSLASLSGLPVRYYVNGKFTGLFHHTKFKPDLAIIEEPNIFADSRNVSYYMDDNLLCYGLFRAREDDVSLVIGPVTPMKTDSKTIASILRKIGEPLSRSDELEAYFTTMPSYPLRNFLQILCTVNYFVNHEKTDVEDYITGESEPAFDVPEKPVQADEPAIHNTMELEEQMLSYVEYGRPDEMKKLFRSPMTGRPGKMAPEAIRQQKNLIVCTATLVTRAAIRGGLDYETAFGLSDLYIQKSEMLTDYVSLAGLNARMVMDFTGRVEKIRSGRSVSKLTISVRKYILEHISEPVSTESIAEYVGLNRTYFCRLFREQNGITVNNFVQSVKTDEAKRLLSATKKSIADIAFSLGYSSQSHFQKTFRSITGTTPLKYRNRFNLQTNPKA